MQGVILKDDVPTGLTTG